MRWIKLAGDHFKMGRQHGYQVRDLLPHLLDVIDQSLKSLDRLKVNLLPLEKELREVWDEKAQTTLDMLRGIADALALDWDTVVTGINEADYSGYPDCRWRTVHALNRAFNLQGQMKITPSLQ